MVKQIKNKWAIILVLGFLIAIGPFSIDMYIPAFESLRADLNATQEQVQLTLTSYFIGIAVGQLFYGPLLDRFGRKPPMLVGLGIYLLSTIVCSKVVSIENLILFRLFQAMGSCGGFVAARAIVKDLFDGDDVARIFSLLTLILGISPILAPFVGTMIIEQYTWRTTFWALVIIAFIIALLVIFVLPESKKADKSIKLNPRDIFINYKLVMKTPAFYINCFAGALISGVLLTYISGSEFVMMHFFGVEKREYSYIFSFIAGGLIFSTQLNNIVLNKYTSAKIAKNVQMFQAFVAMIMLALLFTGVLEGHGRTSMYILIGLIFTMCCCQGLSSPNVNTLALEPFHKLSGSASALLGSVQMGLGAVVSGLVSLLHNDTIRPMVIVMSICSILSAIILYSTHKKTIEMPKGHLDKL